MCVFCADFYNSVHESVVESSICIHKHKGIKDQLISIYIQRLPCHCYVVIISTTVVANKGL